MKDPVRWAILTQGDGEIRAWIDADRRLKPGTLITLEDGPAGLWTVKSIGTMRLERAVCRKTWRVGGLL